MGQVKAALNIGIGINNFSASYLGGKQVEPHEASSEVEAASMHIADVGGLVVGLLLGGRGPANVLTGESKETSVVSAETGNTKTFQTYTKTNPTTGEVYVGRTSGEGTPLQNIAKRDSAHDYNRLGFGPAKLDKSSTNYAAIRGREQEMINMMRQLGNSANKINGISPRNPNRTVYCQACGVAFGTPK